MSNSTVIVLCGGIIEQIYSPYAEAKFIVVNRDKKHKGYGYGCTYEYSWPDTQYDDDEIMNLLGYNPNEMEEI